MASATSSASTSKIDSDLRLLTVCTLVVRACTVLLVYLASHLPSFDSSANTLLDASTPHLTASLLRWDAFHFAHIAREGYVYEHEWAFLPGLPLVMHLFGRIISSIKSVKGYQDTTGWEDVLFGGALAAVACHSTHTLYRLSIHHINSPSLALIASLLSLLPSSPATLHFAAYTEPFFTCCSYKGRFSSALLLYSSRHTFMQTHFFFKACWPARGSSGFGLRFGSHVRARSAPTGCYLEDF